MASRRTRKARSYYLDTYEEPDVKTEEAEGDQEEEIDEEDESEVTRCICGNQELQLDPSDKHYNDEKVLGLFIQCDECNVWQHGYCVLIYEEQLVPEKYWCERCRPELHNIQIGPYGSFSQYLPVQPKKKRKPRARPKIEEEYRAPTRSKRLTMNLNNDVMLEKVLRESAMEFGREGKKNEGEEEEEEAEEEPVKEESEAEEEEEEEEGEGEETKKEEVEDVQTNPEEEHEVEPEAEAEKDKESEKDKEDSKTEAEPEAEEQEKASSPPKRKRREPKKGRKKSEEEESGVRKKRDIKPRANGKAKAHANGNSIALNSDKPIEPRIPPPRITMHEMRKRITAISEYIYYVQADLCEEQQLYEKMLSQWQLRGSGTNSAETSNVSLEDEEEDKFIENFQALIAHHQSGSIEMIGSLQRQIRLWEEKFGSYDN